MYVFIYSLKLQNVTFVNEINCEWGVFCATCTDFNIVLCGSLSLHLTWALSWIPYLSFDVHKLSAIFEMFFLGNW